MAITVDALYQEALNLTDDSRIALAERLIESVEADPSMIEAHMSLIRQRLDDLESGRVQLVPGSEGLQQVREAVLKRSKG